MQWSHLPKGSQQAVSMILKGIPLNQVVDSLSENTAINGYNLPQILKRPDVECYIQEQRDKQSKKTPLKNPLVTQALPGAVEKLSEIINSKETSTAEKLKAIELIGKLAGIK